MVKSAYVGWVTTLVVSCTSLHSSLARMTPSCSFVQLVQPVAYDTAGFREFDAVRAKHTPQVLGRAPRGVPGAKKGAKNSKKYFAQFVWRLQVHLRTCLRGPQPYPGCT